MMEIKWRLAEIMEEKRLQNKDLAENTGLHPVTISQLKNNPPKEIKLETLEKLCEALNCSPCDLLFYTLEKSTDSIFGDRFLGDNSSYTTDSEVGEDEEDSLPDQKQARKSSQTPDKETQPEISPDTKIDSEKLLQKLGLAVSTVIGTQLMLKEVIIKIALNPEQEKQISPFLSNFIQSSNDLMTLLTNYPFQEYIKQEATKHLESSSRRY